MKTKIKITRAKPAANVPFGTLSIELNRREAEALCALCHRIGGDPTDSPRALFDGIREALVDMGIEAYTSDYIEDGDIEFGGSRGSIHFKNYGTTDE